ncbi:hypothetical protein DXH95_09795 [Sphingorhabdus pulchriflava]|uniref:Uncharacterized protein n=1 Tax=Sphingorhabdus pulchriflava TaxID=2292257 RepID=A0A371BJN8_9SPHN|nr:hypothetical protein [Sphingorhabdus pulchriflava]RDV07603.1 hypothetical protein DXH95_09795 [Sphingorhabdus pulchriflava]
MTNARRSLWILLATIAFTSPVHADWKGTSWGQQPSDVERIIGAKAKSIRPSIKDREGVGKLGNTYFFVDGSTKSTANFYYDDRGLKSIEITSKSSKCNDVFSNLTKIYGKHIRHSNQTILHLFIWHDVEQHNRIRLLVIGSGSQCSTYYERLADYEEIDKSSTN